MLFKVGLTSFPFMDTYFNIIKIDFLKINVIMSLNLIQLRFGQISSCEYPFLIP